MTLMRMLAFIPGHPASDKRTSKNSKIASSSDTKPSLLPDHQKSDNTQKYDSPNEAWLALVNQLKLSGMARMLAQYCEAKFFSAEKIEFCVADMHKHLLEKTYQDRLRAQLEAHFGRPVKVIFSLGSVTGVTLAVLQNRGKLAKQSLAIDAIEADPYVQELIEQFDAKLNISSIKPIE